MYISIQSTEREFETPLHFVVIEGSNIVGASIIGYQTSVKAIFGGIVEGRRVRVYNRQVNRRKLDIDGQDRSFQLDLDPYKGGVYRKVEKPVGIQDNDHHVITHSFITHKHSIFNIVEEEEGNSQVSPYVYAFDGDIQKAVGEFLSNQYALPREWVNEYKNLIPSKNITELEVIINPQFPLYQNLRVIRLDVNEKSVIEWVSEALKSGQLTFPVSEETVEGYFEEGMDMKTFLKRNAQGFANKLKSLKPYHTPDQPLHWSIAEMNRTPFPAQAHVAMGLANALEEMSSVICSGDMGTGKSIITAAVTKILHERNRERGRKRGTAVLLCAPSITIPKWVEKEIGQTLLEAKTEIINNTADALKLRKKVLMQNYKPTGIEFVAVGLDRAKLGPHQHFAGIWKRVKGRKEKAWHCPTCFGVLEVKEDGDTRLSRWSDVVANGREPNTDDILRAKREDRSTREALRRRGITLEQSNVQRTFTPGGYPRGAGFYQIKWVKNSPLKKCQHCNDKLWRPALKSRGEDKNRPRWFISKILKSMKKYFDLFVQDEVHKTKAEDSGRGDAFAQMVGAARKGLFLTGTLVNGKSTSIKEILWRIDPKALLSEGFNHQTGSIAWARRYGVITQVIKYEREKENWAVRGKRKPLQPVEEPGIAPQLTAHHLLHRTAFIELGDLGLPLVELKEIPVILDMDEEHKIRYQEFHYKLYKEALRTRRFGSFIPATINYGDRPDLGASVKFYDGEIPYYITAEATDANYFHAKERFLVKTIQKELAENRGCVIFTNYTDGYGVNERLKYVLNTHGIEAEILDATVPSLKRIEWLQQREQEGRKVIITNQQLVEVGLDMLYWPTIIFYQLNYDVNKVRQASRRSWRTSQDREVRVYYLVYDGTQQMAQFKTVMAKRGHSMIVEGRIDKSALAQYSRNSQSSIACDIADCLASADIAKQWKMLASKDMDQNIKLVSEMEFKSVVQETMQRLAKETKSLCIPKPSNLVFLDQKRAKKAAEIIKKTEIRFESELKTSEQIDLFDLIEFEWKGVKFKVNTNKKRKKSDPNEGQISLVI